LARYRIRVARYDEEKKKYIDLASIRFETDLPADKVISAISMITQTIQALIDQGERIRAIFEVLDMPRRRVEKHE
jgi:hypothetical protein